MHKMASSMNHVCRRIIKFNKLPSRRTGILLNQEVTRLQFLVCKHFSSGHLTRLISHQGHCLQTTVTTVYSIPNVRHSSHEVNISEPISEAVSQVAEYIPPPPDVPDPQTFIDTLNHIGEPTFTSLGLGGYWPSGLVQSGLEFLHVSCDMSWMGAIILGTVCLRVCLFPIIILSQRNVAKMHNHMPEMQRLQDRFAEARRSGNQMAAAKRGQELYTYMQQHKVNPLKNMLVPFAQLPIFLSVFIGIRQMANLPVESMMTGGLYWFTNLTIPDPFYGLPLLTASTMLLTIELGSDGVKAGSMGHNVKWLMRAMPVLVFPFISNFPAAMCVYWATANVFSLCQVMILKEPRVRKFFKIEKLVTHERPTAPKKKFIEGFKESWSNAQLQQQIEERQKVNALKFKKSGSGPIPKTFAYDPTKVNKDK